MASFISQRRKHELNDQKILASVGYSAGMIASMSMSKKRPKFNEVFKFPDEEVSIEQSKAQMIVWAEQLNKQARRKGGKVK